MAEGRSLEVMVISAKGLKNVKHLRQMCLYVSATVSGGDSRTTFTSPVDYEGGPNPVWNFATNFLIDKKELMSNSLVLVFQIRCSRAIRGDKDVGDVHVPLKDLLDKSNHSSTIDQRTTTTLQVRVPFGGTQGELTFSYAFDSHASPQEGATSEDRTLQHVPAQAFVDPNAGVHEMQQGYAGFIATVYTQTSETTYTTCVEPPLGYPPLGPGQNVPVMMHMAAYPPVGNPVLPFPPPNPTMAPPIATDSPLVLSGIPGVDIDREKTEYELKLEGALAGLLHAIGTLEVDQEDAKN